ncbi:MAG: hypothetical protein A2Z96_02705 [Spirochaetes bacterium GWB1_48_6]|nr:MAG: hypothetical protein A2Z96_02705 [Spirochaetes bacterium GWB1_48_6]
MASPLLKVVDLSFGFDPKKQVVDRVSFSLSSGEILGIAGENGAGKTTLARLIAGELTPGSGTINLSSHKVSLVPQHPVLSPDLFLWENILLGREETQLFQPFSQKKLDQRLTQAAESLGFTLNFHQKTAGLSASVLQKAALTGALLNHPSLLILDEPTSSLHPTEARALLETVRTLASQQGLGIILISHRLEELFFLCDLILVLQEGKILAQVPKKDFTIPVLSALMLGTAAPLPREKPSVNIHEIPVLSLKNVSSISQGRSALKNITLDLYPGEILGLAGIREEGLSQLEDIISGLVPWTSGEIYLQGRPLAPGKPKLTRQKGLGYVPADRMNRGSVPEASLLENIIPHQVETLSPGGFLHQKHTLPFFKKMQTLLSFEGHPHQKLQELSGGNIQRLILSREFETNPEVLLLSEPSWGLDLKSRRVLHDILRDIRSQGRSILLLSSDLGELLDLSDRLGVLHGGALTALKPVQEWTAADLDLAILGAP